jgi:hypothetical protein
MSITDADRHYLYEFAKSQDERAAEILMSMLPPVGWADVATKHDLAHLESRIDRLEGRFDRLDDKVDTTRTSFITWLIASQAAVIAAFGITTGVIAAVLG